MTYCAPRVTPGGPATDLPDAGEGACCWGNVIGGPNHCTCWVPVYDLEQGPLDETLAGWLAAGVEPNTAATMCGGCAYRPGSPEKLGDDRHAADADELERVAGSATDRFFCHAGIRRVVRWRHPSGAEIDGHAASYHPPIRHGAPWRADGQPAELCAGWAARRRALTAGGAR
ncbi:hypothetical protein GCM10023201_41340 [Actinomycetospora corticicola]|uniref:Uncharacterized protein n=1 Tax=Actinomycetospora corticicola TaxID=663602 RepID=A0A7Y9DWP0_9PSEU|nr:hypothetical protein [Actinomycetospora corticicola]NYD36779.1 hypothetical protein [Actinomycetospora corticicola]